MTNLTEVAAMLPIVTPFTMPTEQAAKQTLYNIAEARVSADAPSLTGTEQTLAYCLVIAHTMNMQTGHAGTTSEHLGNWSASYSATAGDSSPYLAEYEKLVRPFRRAALISRGRSVTHRDTYCSEVLSLDASRPGCGQR